MNDRPKLDATDEERLDLLDRIADRLPDLDLGRYTIEWTEMPDDGSQALMVEGVGIDGDNGFTIASHGDDLHVVGPTAPLIPGYYGCVVVRPDGSRQLAHVVPDPLAK